MASTRQITFGLWLKRLAFGSAILVPCYLTYRHFHIRGLEAEARIMMSYIHSLESGHHLENNDFAYFSEWYGAPVSGTNNCNQPSGARTLGFNIRWCRGEGQSDPVRFAYRVRQTAGQDFVVEAISGSDEHENSFVCFGRTRSRWSMDSSRVVRHLEGC